MSNCYNTGETPGRGHYYCKNCGFDINLSADDKCPPCPNCTNTTFEKV